MADRAVLAGDVLVGKDDVQLRAVFLVLVRPAGQVDHLVALDAAGARIHRVRADGREIVKVEGEDFSCFCDRYFYVDPVFPRMDVGGERFQPVGDELHRPVQHHRQRRRRHFVRIDVHLDAEGAADVLGDHAHAGLGDAEVARENVLHHVRRLGRVVDRQRMLGRVVVGENRAPLQANAGVPAEMIGFLHHHRIRPREGLVHAARVERAAEANVVAKLLMDNFFTF